MSADERWGRRAQGPAPTIMDVARVARTSKSTVSNVIMGRGRMSPQTRARVLDAMQTLGYRPNAAARSLAARRTSVIGVVVGDLSDLFNAEIAAQIERHAAAAGYALLLVSSDAERESEVRRVETLIEHRVAAIVFLAYSGSRAVLEAIPPSVSVVFATVQSPAATSVTIDDERALELVVDHLADLGHRRIGYVSTAYERPIDDALFAWYERALERRSLSLRERTVLRWGLDGTRDEGEAKAAALRAFLTGRQRPTAVFASSDRTALQLLGAASEAGLRVPEDVSIVGWGDTELARARAIELTTVAQPNDELARRAVELATEPAGPARGRRRVHVRLEPQLIVRGTTAAPPTRGS